MHWIIWFYSEIRKFWWSGIIHYHQNLVSKNHGNPEVVRYHIKESMEARRRRDQV
jgi:hypothetical protein